jgi:hypothetical protein
VPSKPAAPKRGKAALAAALAALALLVLAIWLPGQGGQAPAGAANVPIQAPGARLAATAGAAGLPVVDERAARLRALAEQVQLTDHTYCSYLASTKYPISSRPMSEQPDQVYPNAPVTEQHEMRGEGGRTSDAKVLMQTSQSRVYMAAGEAVAFSLRAVDPEGKTLPLVVTRAVAQGLTAAGARPAQQVALAFADDGRGADPVAGDGAFAGVLAPANSSLATFNGTIRTEVRYSVDGRNGLVYFDVIYSPELPATWSGQVREAVEGGSLVFFLKADVRQAGRYIVAGRVDDAKGKPFALATFNDLLPQGPAEVKLTVFGKLLRDEAPALPLTLRDVDGYLLRENVDPDRALMPRLEGKVLASKQYPLKGFSDAEWQGEERTRYLAELGKDAKAARAALKAADPDLVVASACP